MTATKATTLGLEDLPTKGQGWALLAMSLGLGVVQLDVSVVNVAIKPIGADLGGGLSGLQWVVNAYVVAFAALILSAGALGDRVGAKRVFLAGFVLFTVASAACGLAPTLGALVAARAVQGVGAAVLVPCSLTLLTHAYDDGQARARAVGLWAAGASAALSLGPLIGGVLTSTLGWRSIFFINAPIGMIGVTLTQRFAKETSRSSDRGVDLAGQAAAAVALAALAGALIEAGQHGLLHPLVIAGFGVATLSAAAFGLIESRRRKPMLPLGLFRSRTFRATSAIGLLVNVAFYGLIFVLSLYFQTIRHYSALRTGLAFAPTTGAILLANLAAGRLTRRFGTRAVLSAASLLMAASLAGLLVLGVATRYPTVLTQLIGLGLGLGLIVPAMTAALLASVDASRSGVASGTLNAARQTGSVIGVSLFGSLTAAHLVQGLRIDLVISIGLAFAVAATARGLGRERERLASAGRPSSPEVLQMRKVVVYELLSLDGVAEKPDLFFGWDDALDANLDEVIATQDLVILGRRSYDEWAAFWPGSDIEPFATFINGVAKYVATSSPLDRTWANTTVVSGPLVEFVRDLKDQPGADIGVHASISVAQALLAAGVVDELKLAIAPTIASSGRRLFDGVPAIRLESIRSATSPTGHLLADYRVIG